jgi:DNA invertase Pin-like site-specific DNA recombinase
VSGQTQEEKGIPQQLEACRQHSQKVGYEIIESCIFTDVKSGTKFGSYNFVVMVVACQ